MDHTVQPPSQMDTEERQLRVGHRVHQGPDQLGALGDQLAVLTPKRQDSHARVDP